MKEMDLEEVQSRISEILKADPALSVIPRDRPREKLRVRHGGYDLRAAQDDFNTVLSIDRIGELSQDGLIGQVLVNAYSFVGAYAQKPLVNDIAPQWAEVLKAQEVDGMILVPV